MLAFTASLDLDEHGKALAALALTLAASLDGGAGMAAAAVGRELRATLAELVPAEEGDGGEPIPGLSSSIFDAKDS